MANRDPRTLDTRDTSERKVTWKRANALPDPDPQEGVEFRWIRTSTLGQSDMTNVSAKYREGWEPCLAEDHPELMIMSDADTTYEGNVVIGGLMLCKCSTELMQKRADYYRSMASDQAASVDQNFMRENDPRMPLLETERKSTVSFGAGRKR